MREERTKEESYTLKDLIYNKTYGPIYNSIYNKRKDISSDIYIYYIYPRIYPKERFTSKTLVCLFIFHR